EMSATSEELAAQAEELQTSIAFFKVDGASARAAQKAAAPRASAPAARPVAPRAPQKQAFHGGMNVAAQQAKAKGFALDLTMGGPDADDADFRESA
ncbi:MAG: methyl-accepting chemotaxis protein, partial [Shinella sp.]